MGGRRTHFLRFALVLVAVSVFAGVAANQASALAFTQGDPCNDTKPLFVCPGGTVNASYSITFKASGGCGPALPYQYSITNGALPPGLTLDKGGTLHGKPTQSGSFNFWVQLSDEDPPSLSWCDPHKADREFQIQVQPGVDIDNQKTTTYGTTNQAYSNQLTAVQLTNTNPRTGTPLTNAQWSIVSGSPPGGVTLSATGLLSGTPTAEGSFQFVVKAALDGSRFDTETLNVVVRSAVVIKSAPVPVPSSEVGVPFQLQLTASGGTGSGYTWTTTGTPPPGVTFDLASGAVSGTPTAPGRYAFAATATDAEGRTATYPVVINVAAKLTVVTKKLRPGKVGKLYRAKLVALGGVQPKLWRVKGRLPRGVKLDRTTGILLGKPTKAGTYRITVEITDALKVKSTQSLVIVVAPAPKS